MVELWLGWGFDNLQLAKISYRLQDLAEGTRKHAFMGIDLDLTWQ